MTKKLQTVRLLLGMKHPEADAMITDLVCSSDFHTAYFVLMEAYFHLGNRQLDTLFGLSSGKDRFDAILAKCRTVHGQDTDLILPVLEEQQRQQNIIQRRSTITGDEHRFFLALLLNVPSREKILELIKQRFPDRDPVETILDWVEELSNTKVLGSNEPNALGLADFDDSYLFVFEGLLKGLNEETMKDSVLTSYPPESAEKVLSRLPDISNRLVDSALFHSMLSS